MIESAIHWLMHVLAMPEVGLSSVFLISFVSATLLPMGSEPAVFAAAKAMPANFWIVIMVATIGNTLGGVLNYWMGYGVRRGTAHRTPGNEAHGAHEPHDGKEQFEAERHTRWFRWLKRFGARTMLLAWLPGIGDPLCSVAGWLRLPFWPSIGYMAVGKFMRYLMLTWLLMEVPDGFWRQVADWLG